MGCKLFRLCSLVMLGGLALGALAPSPATADILRTLRISRPSLGATSSQPGRDDPRTLGPGGARRYAGEVTQTEYEALGYGDEVQFLTNAKIIKNPPGCGAATIFVSGDSIRIEWGSECVDPGESVVVQFTSPDSVTGCGTGVWRDNAYVTVATATCMPFDGMPGLSPAMLVALGALLALVGFVMLRRRQATDLTS